jgi:hypothetical protein
LRAFEAVGRHLSFTAGAQALTVNNALPVTAIGPLMLTSALTGGIVQSLIAFQNENVIRLAARLHRAGHGAYHPPDADLTN